MYDLAYFKHISNLHINIIDKKFTRLNSFFPLLFDNVSTPIQILYIGTYLSMECAFSVKNAMLSLVAHMIYIGDINIRDRFREDI